MKFSLKLRNHSLVNKSLTKVYYNIKASLFNIRFKLSTVMLSIVRRSVVTTTASRQCLLRGIRSISLRRAISCTPIRPIRPITMKLVRSLLISTDGQDVDAIVDVVSATDYNKIANHYLEQMIDELEQLAETSPEIDCELSQGVLTLTVPSLGSYVINKQPPNKQIWLSSPVSGPKRFDLIGGRWITLRDGSSLTDLVGEEIKEGLGVEFEFGLEQ